MFHCSFKLASLLERRSTLRYFFWNVKVCYRASTLSLPLPIVPAWARMHLYRTPPSTTVTYPSLIPTVIHPPYLHEYRNPPTPHLPQLLPHPTPMTIVTPTVTFPIPTVTPSPPTVPASMRMRRRWARRSAGRPTSTSAGSAAGSWCPANDGIN